MAHRAHPATASGSTTGSRRRKDSAVAQEAPAILITHFINPHLFWFKYESEVVQNVNQPLQDLEQELAEHTTALKRRSLYSSGYEPDRGEHVAVMHLTWKKWIRVRVDTTIDCLSGGKKYILWATDHGVPLESTSKWLRPLPQHLADRRVRSVYQAGIADIVPAEQHLNYVTLKTELVQIDKWSSHAIQTFEDVLTNVENIQFTRTLLLEEPDEENNHCFGHLEFTLSSGALISPSSILQQFNYALPVSNERFSKGIQMAITRSIPRWLDNNRILKRYDNVMPAMKVNRSAVRPPPGFPDIAVREGDDQWEVNQKISEWNLRNQKATVAVANDFPDSGSSIQSFEPKENAKSASSGLGKAAVANEAAKFTHYRPDSEYENVIKRCGSRHSTESTPENASVDSKTDVTHALKGITHATEAVHTKPVVREVDRPAVKPDGKKRQLTSREAIIMMIKNNSPKPAVSPATKTDIKPPLPVETVPVVEPRSTKTKNDTLKPPDTNSFLPVEPDVKPVVEQGNGLPEREKAYPKPPDTPSIVSSSSSDLQKPAFVHPRTKLVKKQPSNGIPSAFKTAANQDLCISNSLFLYNVLVHGLHLPRPLEKLAYANFADEVHGVLKVLRFSQMYRIQAYAWPHLMRGNSLVLVNGAGSGKTMSYLPAVCSLILAKCETDGLVPEGKGPLAIVVCVSSKKVRLVSDLCRRFMQDADGCAPRIVEAFGIRNERQVTMRLLEGCSILVCTAPSLERLINDATVNLFSRARLQYFVVDDLDLIVNRFSDSLKAVLRKCVHFPAGQTYSSVQLVVTSRTWTPALRMFFRIGQNAVLLMGAFAEAAVYARSNVQIELLNNEEKDEQVLDFLIDHKYQEQRTIVVCNKTQEAVSLAQRCREKSLFFMLCHSDSLDNEITMAQTWDRSGESGTYPVLICTDQILPQLQVFTAKNIIHYSIPASWTTYSNRFSSSLEYYEDFVVNQSSPVRESPISLILLDEDNNVQLPRLIDFMLNHGVDSIDPAILNLVQKIASTTEELRNRLMVPFCPEIMMLGECLAVACKLRHVLTESDASRESIPRHGVVKLVVMEVLSPIQFSARLIAHRESGSNEWKPHQGISNYVQFSILFMSHYSDPDNHRSHGPAELGQLCVIAEGNSYHRCRITEVKKNRMNVLATIYLIDTGKVMTCRSPELLWLDDKFRDFPAQAVQIRIARCVPYDFDSDWASDVCKTVKQWLINETVGNAHVEGRIELSVLDTLWLDSLRVVERLPDIGQSVQVMSVRRNLLDKQFATDDDKAIDHMTHMAKVAGIWQSKRANQTPQETNTYAKLEQIADKKSPVIEPGAKNGTRTNADDVLKQINSEDEIPVISIAKPTTKDEKENINPIVLDLVGVNPNQSNGASSNECSLKDEQIVQPVCVTSQQRGRRHRGSSQPVTPNPHKDEVLKERWADLPFDQFEKVHISQFYSPNLFYVQKISACDLFASIDEYTAMESSRTNRIRNVSLGQLCLAQQNGEYNRAKIIQFSCTSPDLVEVTVFFVDLGERLTVPYDELLVLPEHLLKMAPFQAILCRLVGLRPPHGQTEWSDSVCNRIFDEVLDGCSVFVKPMQRCKANTTVAGSDSYAVVAFDYDENRAKIHLNETIVDRGLASYDDETKHLMKVDFNPPHAAEPDESGISADTLQQWEDMNFDFTMDELMEFMKIPPSANVFEPIPSQDEGGASTTKAIMDKKDSAEGSIVDEECANEPLASVVTERVIDEPMPPLKSSYKMPNILWQQNHMAIYLNIHAPDNKGYWLDVTNRTLNFRSKLNDDQIVGGLINFFGCIDTEFTSHELRGLWVRVRLMKTLRGPQYDWPRLTLQEERCHWIKYNMDAIGLNELGDSKQMLVRPKRMSYSDDSSEEETGSDEDYDFDN